MCIVTSSKVSAVVTTNGKNKVALLRQIDYNHTMPSEQYHEGRLMESNQGLHDHLKEILKFDRIEVDGGTDTKGDTFGVNGSERVPISIKYPSGLNTQVHLTTLDKLAQDLAMPDAIKGRFDRFFGTRDNKVFESWCQGLTVSDYERDHNRLVSTNIDNWLSAEQWVNQVNKDLSLPRLLIQSLNQELPVKYLVWVRKKAGGMVILDVNKLVQWIGANCTWITMPMGTVLRCVAPNERAILWLQMKGNREPYGHNHTPQFHINENWPAEAIVYENARIRF